jgi:phage/plasmid-associated DNA primase
VKKVTAHVTWANDVYHSYKEWCDRNGVRPTSNTKLGIIMSERGFHSRRASGGKRIYDDLQITSDASDASDPIPDTFF